MVMVVVMRMRFCLALILVSSLVLGIPVASEDMNMMMMVNPVVELSSRDELVDIAGYGEEKVSKVRISGRVVCHDHACPPRIFRRHPPAAADHHYQPPNPISGASVAVFCGTSGIVGSKSWAPGTTDEYGDFLIDLPSHLHAIPNLENVCILKVLHLPTYSHCRPAFRGKHKAIKLRSIDDGGARTYTANTIHFTTYKPSCKNTRSRKQMVHVY